jgi:hypothetical protein
MAAWLVTQGDRQFSAQDLAELKQLAVDGKISSGDMIQPPGASDWLYASELPELKELLKSSGGGYDDDLDMPRKKAPTGILAVLALGVIAGGGYFMYDYASRISAADLDLLGSDGLALSEMLVTCDPAPVYSGPEEASGAAGSATKNGKVSLVAKRGDFYQVTTETGTQGWVKVDCVVPAYFFADKDTRTDYDPIYNPDRYVFVKNSSWMQLPDQRSKNTTLFSFLLQNKSKFEMTDIVLMATIKDKNDKVLETKEIPIEGSISKYSGSMVGTLAPARGDREGVAKLMTNESFSKLAEADPELQMRWSDGIEVLMDSEGFVEANIDLLQVRAVPKKLN